MAKEEKKNKTEEKEVSIKKTFTKKKKTKKIFLMV